MHKNIVVIILTCLSHLIIARSYVKMESLLQFRNLTLEDLKQKYKLEDADIMYDASYQKMEGLTRADKPDVLPGTFYYRGDNVALIYIGEDDVKPSISVAEIFKEYGKGKTLKSRAGKTSLMHVYPQEGFAISKSGDDTIEFMEIFPSMSLKEYTANVYEEVLFIR